jgi:hypothetical protein
VNRADQRAGGAAQVSGAGQVSGAATVSGREQSAGGDGFAPRRGHLANWPHGDRLSRGPTSEQLADANPQRERRETPGAEGNPDNHHNTLIGRAGSHLSMLAIYPAAGGFSRQFGDADRQSRRC